MKPAFFLDGLPFFCSSPLQAQPQLGGGDIISHTTVPRGSASQTIPLLPHINIPDTRLKTWVMHIHLLFKKCQKDTNIPSLYLEPHQKYLSAFWHLIPFVIVDAIYQLAVEDEVLQKGSSGWMKLHQLRPQRG